MWSCPAGSCTHDLIVRWAWKIQNETSKIGVNACSDASRSAAHGSPSPLAGGTRVPSPLAGGTRESPRRLAGGTRVPSLLAGGTRVPSLAGLVGEGGMRSGRIETGVSGTSDDSGTSGEAVLVDLDVKLTNSERPAFGRRGRRRHRWREYKLKPCPCFPLPRDDKISDKVGLQKPSRRCQIKCQSFREKTASNGLRATRSDTPERL